MGKSNYEIYAEKKQEEALKTTKTFEEVIDSFATQMQQRSELWCLAAGSYACTLLQIPRNKFMQMCKDGEYSGVVKTEVTLENALNVMKGKKLKLNGFSYQAMCEFAAELYELSYDELERAVEGRKYWIV